MVYSEEIEQWSSIIGYEGLYEISSLGKIKYLSKGRGTNKKCIIPEGIMSQIDNGSGYLTVSLCKEGIKSKMYIHILVVTYFIPNPNNLPEVNHKFGIKNDNRASQLEWVTKSENEQHAYATGLKGTGYMNKRSKPISQYTMDGVFLERFANAQFVQNKTGYHRSVVGRAARGKLKQAYGFLWKME